MTRPSRLHIRPLAIVLAGALLLGPTLALEVGTRLLIDRDRLPVATSSQLLTDIALSNLEHLGKPDVLVVGTSATRDGLQPDVLEDLIREASGRDVRVQGIAQGGMSLEAQRLGARPRRGRPATGDRARRPGFRDPQRPARWLGCR